MFKKFVCLLGILILTSCAATGPKFQEKSLSKSEHSLIYVYRPNRTINCCVAPKVYIDQIAKNDLKNGGYVVYEVPAGNHEVIVGDGSYGFTPEKINLSVSPGERIYLKWIIGDLTQMDTIMVGAVAAATSKRDYHLIQVPKVKANPEIAELKLSQ